LEELSPMAVNETNEEVNQIKCKGTNESKGKGGEQKGKKMKRAFSSEDSELMIGLIEAIRGFCNTQKNCIQ
jgi:hypothetical protein